jgi:hypothetical protein
MSNRHRVSRRRIYGRRQHELRERRHRRDEWQLDPVELAHEIVDDAEEAAHIVFFGARAAWAAPR